jgi:hypothetical protein
MVWSGWGERQFARLLGEVELVASKEGVLAKATRYHVSEDGFLHSYCREKVPSYIALTGCAL